MFFVRRARLPTSCPGSPEHTVIIPEETPLTAPYWEAARQGRVALQRCRDCEWVWHPPMPACPECRSADIEWFESSGRGWINSLSTIRHAAHPAVSQALPYVVCLIQLEEGPRVITNLCGEDIEAGAVGTAVTLGLGPTPGGPMLVQAWISSVEAEG
jgi:uncharacterized OB-fold protein